MRRLILLKDFLSPSKYVVRSLGQALFFLKGTIMKFVLNPDRHTPGHSPSQDNGPGSSMKTCGFGAHLLSEAPIPEYVAHDAYGFLLWSIAEALD
jgi:hypothetical protein